MFGPVGVAIPFDSKNEAEAIANDSDGRLTAPPEAVTICSCNPEKRLVWLNLDLAKKPLVALDYVILHEMAHFVSPRHDDLFLSCSLNLLSVQFLEGRNRPWDSRQRYRGRGSATPTRSWRRVG
jgi:hypothetical protein